MFRRTWKQIKIAVAVIIIIIVLPTSLLPRVKDTNDIDYYSRLNDLERWLPEYKDSRSSLELKLKQLEQINRSRKKFNAKPLQLDILASRVANRMSREAAEHNFVGHWDLEGEKPYQRYAFAGGYDHVSENAYGEWSSRDYENTPESISSLMQKGHATFMAEKAPNDGHKRTVIEKDHNFVGIGFYLTGKQFRYYEEYIDRYFEFDNIPDEVRTGEKTGITVKTSGRDFLYFMVVYYEKFPQRMSPKDISSRGTYNDFTEQTYLKVPAWELAKYRNGPFYRIPLSFSKEGLYYIQIYSDKKEITKPANLDTKGKTPYSGIVIRVKN
jgi:uncharacterized protein YkwD